MRAGFADVQSAADAIAEVELKDDEVFAFKLVAEEVLTNIIQYGYPDRPKGLIVVAFECDTDFATMKIWDDGNHFSPDEVAPPDIEAGWEERQIGGLGVFLMNELMDEVAYSREPNGSNLLVVKKERS